MADPLELPDIAGWEEVEFDPVALKDTERMQGRRTETVRGLQSWWKARYAPGFLNHRDYGRMDSFMMRADGGGEYFRAHDPFRPRPMAHDNNLPLSGTRAGGGAFDGTAALDTITDSQTVAVSGLPSGFEFRQGDYVEFSMSSLMLSLHRIAADATADVDGEATLSIRYALPQIITTSAIVNFEKPSCIMQIDAGSYSGVKARRSRRPSFSATELFPYEPEA